MFQTTNQYTTISLYSHRRPVPVSPVRQGRQDFLLCRVQHRTLHVYLSGRWSQNTTIVDWIYWKKHWKNIGKHWKNIGKHVSCRVSIQSIYLSICLSFYFMVHINIPFLWCWSYVCFMRYSPLLNSNNTPISLLWYYACFPLFSHIVMEYQILRYISPYVISCSRIWCVKLSHAPISHYTLIISYHIISTSDYKINS